MNHSKNALAVFGLLVMLVSFVGKVEAAGKAVVALGDNTPKQVFYNRMNSWRLSLSDNLLKNYGIQNAKAVNGAGKGLPVTDNMTLEPNSWIEKFKTSHGASLANTTTYVVVFTLTDWIDTTNQAAVEREVDKMLVVERALKEMGVHAVIFSSRHYMLGRGPWLDDNWKLWWSDPAIMRAYNRRTGSTRAVDVFTPTIDHYPLSVLSDRYHPAGFLGSFYGMMWTRAILENEGLSAPPDFDQHVEQFRLKSLEERESIQAKIVGQSNQIRVGSELSFEVSFQGKWNSGKMTVALNTYRGEIALQHYIKDYSVNQSGTNKVSFTIPESSPMLLRFQYPPGYRAGSAVPLLPCDSVELQIAKPISGQAFATNAYWYSKAMTLVDKNGQRQPYTPSTPISPTFQSPKRRAASSFSTRSILLFSEHEGIQRAYSVMGRPALVIQE